MEPVADISPPSCFASCSEVVRTLRATGASAPPLSEKLRLTRRLARAGERCLFPHARRFALQWLCGALRGARPRSEAACWQLLGELIGVDGIAGSDTAEDETATAIPSPPADLAAQLAQSTRLLLQAASGAFGAAAGMPDSAASSDGAEADERRSPPRLSG